MPELLRLYRCAAVGWETVAECEACAVMGDLSGCFTCDGRGWRQLTEDEEHELSEMQS